MKKTSFIISQTPTCATRNCVTMCITCCCATYIHVLLCNHMVRLPPAGLVAGSASRQQPHGVPPWGPDARVWEPGTLFGGATQAKICATQFLWLHFCNFGDRGWVGRNPRMQHQGKGRNPICLKIRGRTLFISASMLKFSLDVQYMVHIINTIMVQQYYNTTELQ